MIFFSRVAAGLCIFSLFYPPSMFWTGISLGCMLLATVASVAHLSVPLRFLTMARNSKSVLVWEVRLAGALTTFIGLQFLSGFGWFQGLRPLFPWGNAFLSVLFLISTGVAYRFETHPAWKTSILPLYYLVSACLVGLLLRSIAQSSRLLPPLGLVLLMTQAAFLFAYRNHLKRTSPTSLKKIIVDKERRVFLAYLWTAFLLPALLMMTLFLGAVLSSEKWALAISCLLGILLERILFFWVEKPVYFLSFIENPDSDAKVPYWIRG